MNSKQIQQKLTKLKAALAETEKELKLKARLEELKKEYVKTQRKLQKADRATKARAHVKSRLEDLRLARLQAEGGTTVKQSNSNTPVSDSERQESLNSLTSGRNSNSYCNGKPLQELSENICLVPETEKPTDQTCLANLSEEKSAMQNSEDKGTRDNSSGVRDKVTDIYPQRTSRVAQGVLKDFANCNNLSNSDGYNLSSSETKERNDSLTPIKRRVSNSRKHLKITQKLMTQTENTCGKNGEISRHQNRNSNNDQLVQTQQSLPAESNPLQTAKPPVHTPIYFQGKLLQHDCVHTTQQESDQKCVRPVSLKSSRTISADSVTRSEKKTDEVFKRGLPNGLLCEQNPVDVISAKYDQKKGFDAGAQEKTNNIVSGFQGISRACAQSVNKTSKAVHDEDVISFSKGSGGKKINETLEYSKLGSSPSAENEKYNEGIVSGLLSSPVVDSGSVASVRVIGPDIGSSPFPQDERQDDDRLSVFLPRPHNNGQKLNGSVPLRGKHITSLSVQDVKQTDKKGFNPTTELSIGSPGLRPNGCMLLNRLLSPGSEDQNKEKKTSSTAKITSYNEQEEHYSLDTGVPLPVASKIMTSYSGGVRGSKITATNIEDSANKTDSITSDSQFESQSYQPTRKRRYSRQQTELLPARKSARIAASQNSAALDRSFLQSFSQESLLSQQLYTSPIVFPKWHEGLSQMLQMSGRTRSRKLFPSLPKLIIEQHSFDANFVEFSLPAEEFEDFIEQKLNLCRVNDPSDVQQTEEPSDQKIRRYGKLFPLFPFIEELNFENSFSEFSLPKDDFENLLRKKVDAKFPETDSTLSLAEKTFGDSGTLCRQGTQSASSVSKVGNDNDSKITEEKISMVIEAEPEQKPVSNSEDKSGEAVCSELDVIQETQELLTDQSEDTDSPLQGPPDLRMSGLQDEQQLDRKQTLDMPPVVCETTGLCNVQQKEDEGSLENSVYEQKLGDSFMAEESPIHFMLLGKLHRKEKVSNYVVVVGNATVSLYTEKSFVWNKINTWPVVEDSIPVKGFSVENEEMICFVLLYKKTDKSSAYVYSCFCDGVNPRCSRLLQHHNCLFGCTLYTGQFAVGCYKDDKLCTHIVKYKLPDCKGLCKMNSTLDDVPSEVKTLLPLEGRPEALLGFTKDFKLHIWNHDICVLLTTINLDPLSALYTADVEMIVVIEEKGLLFAVVMKNEDPEEKGCVVMVNPNTGRCKILHRFMLQQHQEIGCETEIVCSVQDGTVTSWDKRHMIKWDLYSGKCEGWGGDIRQCCFPM